MMIKSKQNLQKRQFNKKQNNKIKNKIIQIIVGILKMMEHRRINNKKELKENKYKRMQHKITNQTNGKQIKSNNLQEEEGIEEIEILTEIIKKDKKEEIEEEGDKEDKEDKKGKEDKEDREDREDKIEMIWKMEEEDLVIGADKEAEEVEEVEEGLEIEVVLEEIEIKMVKGMDTTEIDKEGEEIIIKMGKAKEDSIEVIEDKGVIEMKEVTEEEVIIEIIDRTGMVVIDKIVVDMTEMVEKIEMGVMEEIEETSNKLKTPKIKIHKINHKYNNQKH